MSHVSPVATTSLFVFEPATFLTSELQSSSVSELNRRQQTLSTKTPPKLMTDKYYYHLQDKLRLSPRHSLLLLLGSFKTFHLFYPASTHP